MKFKLLSKHVKFIPAIATMLVSVFLNLSAPQQALAVRPFVTDDARVVGDKLFLLETSLKGDNGRLQNLNLLAYGPSERLELTVGFVDGFPFVRSMTRTGSPSEGHWDRPSISSPKGLPTGCLVSPL